MPLLADQSFDLVFSSDVLEHVSPEEAEAAVAEMVRVARTHIVLSISLKSHFNEQLHTLLRPRQWWEAKFQKYGAVTDKTLVWALQDKDM
jgi:ubiquinone/menaquinone biosynthesis C-methylase UbiE